MSDWLTPGRFALLLGLLIVACFPQVVFGLETFVYADAGQFALPVAFYHRESFWRGELPLWNPLSSCGIPFLAQWNTLTLYPLSLVYLLLPFPWSFGIFILGHLWLAGMGMHHLAYRWTNHRLAASLAGAVFSFNGLTWYGFMWPHIIAALAWMPWVVLATEQAWRRGGRAVIAAALAGAMQLLSGGAEVILQTWMVLGVLWAAECIRGETRRWRMTGRVVVVGGLAAALAAVQLAPFLDLLFHSQRSTGYNTGAMAGVAAMPLTGWANFLVPLFHCIRNPQGVFVQATQSWTGSYYMGVGVVALAVLAVWRIRTARVLVLAGVGLFGLTMAFGSRGLVYEAFRHAIPVLGFIRFPVKFVVLAIFILPVLAAYGVSWVRTFPADRWPGERKQLVRVVVVLLALMVLITGLAWKFPQPGEPLVVVAFNAAMRAVFLLLIIGCVVILRRATDAKLQRVLQMGLIVLLWFDVFTHSSDLSPTAPARVVRPDFVREQFHWGDSLRPGMSRVMQSRDSLWNLLSSGSAEPELDVQARRLAQFMDLNLLDQVPKFDGFYALDLKEYLDVFKHVYFTTNDPSRLQDFVGISYVSNPTNILDWRARASFLPWITAGQQPVFADAESTMGALFSRKFDPAHEVYLLPEVRDEVHVAGPASVRIERSDVEARRWSIELTADAPAMVVLAQTFYHSWHAYVDGKETPLWRANYAFAAMAVPAGRHRVEVVYQDTAFRWGAVVSIGSIVGCGIIWLWFRRKGAPFP